MLQITYLQSINSLLKEQKHQEAERMASENGFRILSSILASIYNKTNNKSKNESKNEKNLKVMLLCNWCSSEQLIQLWNKMNYLGSGITLTTDNPDYWVVINSTDKHDFDKKKTIVFRMEPKMHLHPEIWGEWSNPDSKNFLKVLKHETGDYNNCEWHLSKNCEELKTFQPVKTKIFSTILSDKYKDPGHVKRVDFVKYLDKKGIEIDVYGNNKWDYKNYKTALPYHKKDEGIFPYKYTFNCENHSISNYFTEKLIDGILGECLTFYWGCPNIPEFIDSRAYVKLELSNFESDCSIIEKAIREDWYSQRLPYIREAKRKILDEMQFIPRLKNLLN